MCLLRVAPLQCRLIFRSLILSLALISNLSFSSNHCMADQTLVRPSAFARINMNTATAEDMSELLIGIGPKKAEAIVEFRREFGRFKTLDDLLQVKGIGEATLEKNKRFITVD